MAFSARSSRLLAPPIHSVSRMSLATSLPASAMAARSSPRFASLRRCASLLAASESPSPAQVRSRVSASSVLPDLMRRSASIDLALELLSEQDRSKVIASSSRPAADRSLAARDAAFASPFLARADHVVIASPVSPCDSSSQPRSVAAFALAVASERRLAIRSAGSLILFASLTELPERVLVSVRGHGGEDLARFFCLALKNKETCVARRAVGSCSLIELAG